MKKNLAAIIALCFIGATAFGQAVSDRNVIPVSVNLNQVLRMSITNGGNIEFVFNTIDEYKAGLSGDVAASTSANVAATEGIYQTDFTVSSSTRWLLSYGAERATLIGTDNPANTLALDNIGLGIAATGTHAFGAELRSTLTGDGVGIAGLEQYPITLIDDNDDAAAANAGDATDNAFTIDWRCGTTEAGATVDMNTVYLIEQSPEPDRYTVNVLFDLATDN